MASHIARCTRYWRHASAASLVLMSTAHAFSFIHDGRRANPDFGTVGPAVIPTPNFWPIPPSGPTKPLPDLTLNITFNTAPGLAVPAADRPALARAVGTWVALTPVASGNLVDCSVVRRPPLVLPPECVGVGGFAAGTPVKRIGGQDFDLESILLHELGHAFGLGHPNFADRSVGPVRPGPVDRFTASTLGANGRFEGGGRDGIIGNFNDIRGDDKSVHLVDSDNNPFNFFNGSSDKSNFSMDGPFTTGGFAQTSTREVARAGVAATGFAAISDLEAVMVQGAVPLEAQRKLAFDDVHGVRYLEAGPDQRAVLGANDNYRFKFVYNAAGVAVAANAKPPAGTHILVSNVALPGVAQTFVPQMNRPFADAIVEYDVDPSTGLAIAEADIWLTGPADDPSTEIAFTDVVTYGEPVSPGSTGDGFGNVLARCDFNGDGFQDLAIGVPNEAVGGTDPVAGAGAVNVLYGSAAGLSSTNNQFWTQDTPGVQGTAEVDDHFGAALVGGDFNGDGFCDLAIGVPGEDVGAVVDAGSVNVLYGSAKGLTISGNQVWDQNKSGVEGSAEAGDRFGSALAAGDFDGDGFADLAVGVPGEAVGPIVDAGAVNVLYGTAFRLSAKRDQLWDQNVASVEDTAETGDHFGAALAADDFNGDGFADLAIGVPDETVGTIPNAGAVAILYGTRTGLYTANDQVWTQNSSNIEGTSEPGDHFGAALASGDFDHDGFADLAIGVPNEDVGTIVDAGAVNILYGAATRIGSRGDQIWDQNKPNVDGSSAVGNQFGRSLSSDDFNGDGFADLAIGIPGQTASDIPSAGSVQILYGGTTRLSTDNEQVWTQNSSGVEDTCEADDEFGAALAAGDFNGDGFADLAIGVPNESVGAVPQAGAVNVLYGAAPGIRSTNDQLWSQNSPGIEDQSE